jgi:uncharacterized protein (UPF0276 family)
VDGVYMHDLLPIPYTNESLDVFSKNIDVTQEFLKQEILIENPSSYIEFKSSYLKESDFLVELCKLTGAKILLDVNNIFVSCFNHDWDALGYINSIPKDLVKEIHLSGHSSRIIGSDQVLLVDTHNDYVCQEVWDLYEHAIQRFGPTPTLIEWDKDIPSFDALISEANRASQYLSKNINETTYA